MASSGLPPISPHTADAAADRLGPLGDQPQGAQVRRAQRVETVGDEAVLAVGREEILHQVVRSDRQEIGLVGDLVDLEQQRGNLDHDAERQLRGHVVAVPLEMRLLALDDRLGAQELVDRRDHREHDRADGGRRRP